MKVVRIKRISVAHEESPELTFLGKMGECDLARAFGAVESYSLLDGQDCSLPGDAEAVLIQGGTETVLTASTFTRMRKALEDGASVVVPSPLHAFPEATRRPIYSIRGFEEAEQGIWARNEAPCTSPAAHLPVALFSRAAFDRIRGRASMDDILDNETLLLGSEGGAERVQRAGIYFQFSDYYGEVRKDVLPFLPKRAGRLLEIGCARGKTGAFLKQALGCHVTGIELNAEIASHASKRIDRVLVGDFEAMELGEKFDAIVATELIEHLRWPERAFRMIHSLLEAGGIAVLTTPNVGHYSIVQDLLSGRWDYVPAGLLCYTHFRFFTRKTLQDVLERAGVRSFQIVPQSTEPPDWLDQMPEHLKADRESLGTKGFYVILNGEG